MIQLVSRRRPGVVPSSEGEMSNLLRILLLPDGVYPEADGHHNYETDQRITVG